MNKLIQVAERQIGDVATQTVNARDLHVFLEVGKDFSAWIKGRIEQYGFVEHHDFVTFDAAPQNGGAGNRGHRVEYAISLDMAKALSMVERQNPSGGAPIKSAAFNLPKRESLILVSGHNVKMRAAIIKREACLITVNA